MALNRIDNTHNKNKRTAQRVREQSAERVWGGVHYHLSAAPRAY
jgi:hypothetical protein